MPVIKGKKALNIWRQGIELPTGGFMQIRDLNEFVIDPRVQRRLLLSWSKAMAKSWKVNATPFPELSLRKAGKLSQLDKQHAIVAVNERIRTHPEEAKFYKDGIVCRVTPGLTLQEEADRYLTFSSTRHTTGNDIFKTSLTGRKEPHITIRTTLSRLGFSLDTEADRKTPEDAVCQNAIYNVWELISLFKRYKQAGLAKAATVLRDVWGGGVTSEVPHLCRNAAILHGLAVYVDGRGSADDIARSLSPRNIDLGGLWRRASSEEGPGRERYKRLADALDGVVRETSGPVRG